MSELADGVVMSKQAEQLVELSVVLRLTPGAHAALVKEAAEFNVSVEELAAVVVEGRFDKRDMFEIKAAMCDKLAAAGVSPKEYAEALEEGVREAKAQRVAKESADG
jgi:hypothetical protein